MKQKRIVFNIGVLIILISTITIFSGYSKDKKNPSNSGVKQEKISSANTGEKKLPDSWDKILDDYEKVIDEYIKIMEKAKTGDPTATMDSITILEKVQKLAEKLENANSDMTPAQISRFTQLQMNFAKSASQ